MIKSLYFVSILMFAVLCAACYAPSFAQNTGAICSVINAAIASFQ